MNFAMPMMMAECCHYRPWKYTLQYYKYKAHDTVQHGGMETKRSAKGKRSGGESIEAKDEIIGQRMTSEVTGKQQKCTRIGPREFVLFEFDKIAFDNIADACQRYFAAPQES